MRLTSHSPWLDRRGRRQQLDKSIRKTKTAYFGFQKVAEQEKQNRIARHFDKVARKYDLMNSLLSFGIHHAWKRTAVRALSLPAGARVIDVCGGTGDLSILAARAAGPAGRVFVYDINRTMMAYGRPKVLDADLGNRIEFVQGNAEAIAFPDNHFDAAMVGFGIRNVTHMETAFAEMHRVLKPGGRLMCLDALPLALRPVFVLRHAGTGSVHRRQQGRVLAADRKHPTLSNARRDGRHPDRHRLFRGSIPPPDQRHRRRASGREDFRGIRLIGRLVDWSIG